MCAFSQNNALQLLSQIQRNVYFGANSNPNMKTDCERQLPLVYSSNLSIDSGRKINDYELIYNEQTVFFSLSLPYVFQTQSSYDIFLLFPTKDYKIVCVNGTTFSVKSHWYLIVICSGAREIELWSCDGLMCGSF